MPKNNKVAKLSRLRLPSAKGNSGLARPPIVAVLGHVDHGKTSLLDFIRKSNQVSREHGQITQHIGAYQIEAKSKEGTQKITFIDTPGHEAFSKIRSRGVSVTDLVILVISAVEGVKPQTVESLEYIKIAQVPFIVAATKMDLSEANLDRVQKHLQKIGVLTENYGGDIIVVPVSAKNGSGVSNLLEMILLLCEMKGLAGANSDEFTGVIIESELDRKVGPLATVLVKTGTLTQGEDVYLKEEKIRIRAMFDENKKVVKKASASQPVRVIGFKTVPPVGSKLTKNISLSIPMQVVSTPPEVLDEQKRLKVILKADTFGSLEAITQKLSSNIKIIDARPGDVTESEILTAETAKAAIIGFNIRISPSAQKIAAEAGILLKNYHLIYELIAEIEEVALLLKTGKEEEILGVAKIGAVFDTSAGKIAGIKVVQGKMTKGDKVTLMREDKDITSGRILELKHGKEDIPKAEQGTECGARLSSNLDFTIGDMLKSISSFEVKLK